MNDGSRVCDCFQFLFHNDQDMIAVHIRNAFIKKKNHKG